LAQGSCSHIQSVNRPKLPSSTHRLSNSRAESVRNCLISGQVFATRIAARMVQTPPPTTAMTGPRSDAARPDSKPPSSFDALMNIPFTADAWPRISSGVRSSKMSGKVKLLGTLDGAESPAISQEPGVFEAEARSRKFPIMAFKTNKTGLSFEIRNQKFLQRWRPGWYMISCFFLTGRSDGAGTLD